ncbi:BnaC04g29210D [Brassica napus]|uniref:BnaC04g29210D protein n=1 Tax=Brassica napus TaxID=3708 RepID=A0A078FEC3_BRANA|nr:BnaC04g29210D [Brassica napus]
MPSFSERTMMIWSLCLIISLSNRILVIASSSRHLCRPYQKDALLEFKNEFHYNVMAGKTESWRNNTDCCSWKGISCDPKTGNVVELDLQDSFLNGPLRSNSSLFRLQHLHTLDLGLNNLTGIIPASISNLKYLRNLTLYSCNLFGKIPSSLGNLSYLTDLDLSVNDFNGELPGSVGYLNRLTELRLVSANLISLVSLDLSFWNTRRGKVDFTIFLHLKSLRLLHLSNMNTKTMINPTLNLPSPIKFLALSSCSIVEFPKFIQSQTRLIYLDISANQIEGQVPEWLWKLPVLWYVNISQNSFYGFEGSEDVIQNMSLMYFSCSDNRFSGEISREICKLVYLDTLVLSNNNFNGSIPRCFENFNTTLSVLNLRNNSISGVFPEESIGAYLQSLEVGHNKISGGLPKSLINCTRLEFLNVEDNMFNDKFPFWLRLLPNLQILVLRSNQFHGKIFSFGASLIFPKLRIFDISRNLFTGVLPSDYFAGWSAMSSDVGIVDSTPVRILGRGSGFYHRSVALTNKGLNMELVGSGFKIYKSIDVSGNRIEGDIPISIGLLKELIVLNMSNNVFTGGIPPSLASLTNLQSLDLSQNRLSGEIPPELGKLTFLARMNFSYNMLEGPIPQGTQIQSQNSSSFAENPGLCGFPLEETCGGKEEEATKQEEDGEKEEKDQVISWISAAIGYLPGVLGGLTIGHILYSYKYGWFMRIFHYFT